MPVLLSGSSPHGHFNVTIIYTTIKRIFVFSLIHLFRVDGERVIKQYGFFQNDNKSDIVL